MNKKYPPFSVLMSVYYKENPRYLDESLKSIQKQTVQPKEIVLVEDGPLSKSLYNVVKIYKTVFNNRLKIVKLAKNSGLGHALRIGTRYITTNWIARMDTDDISVPNRFEIQLNEVIRHPNLAVIGGQIDEFIGSINNIVSERRVPLTEKDIYKFTKFRNPFNHPTVMINKKKLLEVGGYKTADKLEDYNLWVQFVKKHYHLKNINKVLVHMRTGNSQYKRRGGLEYLINYMKMKNSWRKQGVGTYGSIFFSDILMLINILLPTKIRKYVYQNILRK